MFQYRAIYGSHAILLLRRSLVLQRLIDILTWIRYIMGASHNQVRRDNSVPKIYETLPNWFPSHFGVNRSWNNWSTHDDLIDWFLDMSLPRAKLYVYMMILQLLDPNPIIYISLRLIGFPVEALTTNLVRLISWKPWLCILILAGYMFGLWMVSGLCN